MGEVIKTASIIFLQSVGWLSPCRWEAALEEGVQPGKISWSAAAASSAAGWVLNTKTGTLLLWLWMGSWGHGQKLMVLWNCWRSRTGWAPAEPAAWCTTIPWKTQTSCTAKLQTARLSGRFYFKSSGFTNWLLLTISKIIAFFYLWNSRSHFYRHEGYFESLTVQCGHLVDANIVCFYPEACLRLQKCLQWPLLREL